MFWSLRENLCGLNHMRRLAGRLVLGRSRLYYVEKVKTRGYAVEPVLDDRGETLNCRLCGYANLRFDLTPGFEMTACSTLGLNLLSRQEKLNLWAEKLPHSSKEALALAAAQAYQVGADPETDKSGVVKGNAEAKSIV